MTRLHIAHLIAIHAAHFPLATRTQASIQARRLIRDKAFVRALPRKPWVSGPTILQPARVEVES